MALTARAIKVLWATGVALAFWAILVQSCLAQQPRVQTVEPGSLVRLTADLAESESAFWIVLDPLDLDYEQVDGGQRMLFASGCTSGQVVVLMLGQKIEDGRIVNRPVRHVITIAGTNPPPDDGPPVPDDPPSSPQGPLYEIAKQQISKVVYTGVEADRPQVADNFEQVATTPYPDIRNMSTELSRMNAETLGARLRYWENFSAAIQAGMVAAGVTTVQQAQPHMLAIARAIREER